MNKQERDDEIEDLLRAIVSGIVLIILILIISIVQHETSASRKVLYEGDCFEIYQQGDKVYIWNKDIWGGRVELDPEDPDLRRIFERESAQNMDTGMGEQ